MADFSELKAAIRQDIKDNTEQEITGDLLQGDLLRMVDDINAAKVDKEPGKGLSSNDFTNEDKAKLDEAIGDAPSDGRIYGRKDGAWEEVNAYSSLSVALAYPSNLSASDMTVVVRYGLVRRDIPYYDGFSLDNIPAGETVRVNIKAPDGYSVPSAIAYDAKYNVTKLFSGNIEAMTTGLYVLDILGSNTKGAEWNAANNDDAAGIRLVTSDYDFACATKFASISNRKGVAKADAAKIKWGMFAVDVTVAPYNLITSSSTLQLVAFSNSEKIKVYMDDNYSSWRTDVVTQDVGFVAAVAAMRFAPCDSDLPGDWMLPDAYMLKLAFETSGFLSLQNSICGWSFSTQSAATNIPTHNYGSSFQRFLNNVVGMENRNNGDYIIPVRVYRGGNLL